MSEKLTKLQEKYRLVNLALNRVMCLLAYRLDRSFATSTRQFVTDWRKILCRFPTKIVVEVVNFAVVNMSSPGAGHVRCAGSKFPILCSFLVVVGRRLVVYPGFVYIHTGLLASRYSLELASTYRCTAAVS